METDTHAENLKNETTGGQERINREILSSDNRSGKAGQMKAKGGKKIFGSHTWEGGRQKVFCHRPCFKIFFPPKHRV